MRVVLLLLVLYVTNSRNNETFRSNLDDHTAELFCHFPDDLVVFSRFLSAKSITEHIQMFYVITILYLNESVQLPPF